MRSPCGDDFPHVVMGIPSELAKEQDPMWVVGSIMFFTRLFLDVASGATYINMMTWTVSLVGLGVTPLAVDHCTPTLLGEEETNSD